MTKLVFLLISIKAIKTTNHIVRKQTNRNALDVGVIAFGKLSLWYSLGTIEETIG